MLRLLVIFVFLPFLVFADSSRFYSKVANVDKLLNAEVGDSVNISLNTSEGQHRLRLTRIKSFNPRQLVDGQVLASSAAPVLFAGKVLSKRTRKAKLHGASASLFDNKLTITYFGHRKRVFTSVVDLNKSYNQAAPQVARTSHAPSYIPLTCGNSKKTSELITETADLYANLPSQPVFSPELVADIGTDADAEYYQVNSSNVNSTNVAIQSIFNSVNAIYLADIGLSFNIVSQNVFTSTATHPYSSIDAETLLNQFTNYTNSNAHIGGDVKHLFTGKNVTADGDDGVVGLAFVGVVCDAPNFAYGFTQATAGLKALVFLIVAHELGHNFDANHTSAGIMKAVLDPNVNSFSNFSIGEITSHINNNMSCLAQNSDVGLKVSKRKKKFKATLTPVIESSACTITLYGAPKKSQLSGDFAKATMILASAGGAANTAIVMSKKVNFSPKKKVFFLAVIDCAGDTSSSAIKKVKKESGTGKVVGVKKFLKKVAKKFS